MKSKSILQIGIVCIFLIMGSLFFLFGVLGGLDNSDEILKAQELCESKGLIYHGSSTKGQFTFERAEEVICKNQYGQLSSYKMLCD